MTSADRIPVKDNTGCNLSTMMHVRWRHHQNGLLSYLRQMLISELFVDVTLCCQGRRLKAHRVLLSASSPYLQALLLALPSTEHATLILHDVLYEDMRSLLDFIYTGGVIIAEESLASFLSTAEALNVTALTDKQLYKTIPADDWSIPTSPTSFRNVPPLIKFDKHRPWLNKSLTDIDKPKNDCNNDIKYNINEFVRGNSNSNADIKPFFDMKIAIDSSRCSSRCYSDSSEDSLRKSIDSGLEVFNSPSYSSFDNKESIKNRQDDLKCCFQNQNNISPDLNLSNNKDEKRFAPPTDIVLPNCHWLRPVPSLMPMLPAAPLPLNMQPMVRSLQHHSLLKHVRQSLGGIVTPSPWAQNGRPPFGLPRRPLPTTVDQVRQHTDVPTNPADKKSLLPELKTKETTNSNETPMELSKKEQHQDEAHHRLLATNSKSVETLKLCKLKERRLQDFYRDQNLSQLASPLLLKPDPNPSRSQLLLKSEPEDTAGSQSVPSNAVPAMINQNPTPNKNIIEEPRHASKDNDTNLLSPMFDKKLKIDANWNNDIRTENLNVYNDRLKSNADVKNISNLLPEPIFQNMSTSGANIPMNDSNNNHNPGDHRLFTSSMKLQCDDCNYESENKDDLEQHFKCHVQNLAPAAIPFGCGVCSKTFPFKSQLTDHLKLNHDAKNSEHNCSHCGKVFLTKASLKVHLRTHTGEKPFHCNECGKQFSQLRNYKYHRSVHEGTKEFAATCPECGKYFNDRGYLSSHMKIHRNRKEYGCEYCGKCFNQRVAYNMHVRIHTGLKPHVCPHCSKSFSRKMLLKQHLRIHTGEKPFTCIVCQKAFADRSNMTLHMRLHSGIKPYTCSVCSKSFTKKHHLKTHMNYHTGVKPYACSKCGLKFSQSSNMRTHFKKCTSVPQSGMLLAVDRPEKLNTNSSNISDNSNSNEVFSDCK